MPTFADRIHRRFRFLIATLCLLGAVACEDDQTPPPQPSGISVVSGDAQYTRKGTQLEEPVVVRVGLEDGAPASGVEVRFQVIEGGGTLSRTLATTGSDGRTSVLWTMGPDTGPNRIRISVADNSSVAVTATATSSEYYCAEEDPAFVRKFAGPNDLMMVTKHASHTGGTAGLVRYALTAPTFLGQLFESYPEGVIQHAVWDCAFSASGDLFISWKFLVNEIVKVAPDGSISHFSTLESELGAEIALTPDGVLVGVDRMGPFYVTCRDTLFRFEQALYSGIDRDAANNNALACNPATGDVYFIYKADRDLLKVPFDGTTAGAPVKVADMRTIAESDSACGMVVDVEDGSIYILVESPSTKAIVRVTAAGVVTTVCDFFVRRGPGDAAGIQDDLAIAREPIRYLYTLDSKNNTFLRYSIAFDQLVEFTSAGDSLSASNGGEGERVGLEVIP